VNGPVSAAVAALEAERLAPVPRASRAVAVDVDDLALVLEALHEDADWRRVHGDVAAAFGRLERAVRRQAG
jgi:hypothetical protein